MSPHQIDARRELDVVIPVKYGSQYLPQAVASVLAQDIAAHIVIVDDGAPTSLMELLADTPSDRFTVMPNERTPGIGGARNTGAAVGTADLLAFLDADDIWPATRTTDLIPLLGERDEHAMAFGMVEQFLDGSATKEDLPAPPRPGYLAGGMLIRRATWESLGAFDEDLPVGEFIDWVARARAVGVPERMTEVVVLRRRIHGNNTTIHRQSEFQSYADVVRRHLRRTQD
jgi:glycosyltransferase involved in cell wall biosynthesis